ncbi:MAG: phosphate-starvation-inducible PsiE family protein [Proteobacteria bacterium]|nr:phosphate-starvation-inducible PsiE family protein [Pseudomonadota bacterium]MBU1388070.1 phosphate-starvation-inducible PsiE family protein [Pseudomonadota bacterium]MBU1542133.1 phosphate-starvation-inducible PsiE family protein [Pseudomonadota bacterium]MBU2431225.1 phosphate-starvation-inducible PsiE family protein [Pseudomonadota bacterium]MBU2482397.1 phosphate-starvation-inducible PsiE family protein [Pseudomonadota bacterium]
MDDMYNPNEPLMQKLRIVIRFSVRCMAVLMTMVIFWGVLDVAWEIFEKLRTPPVMLMTISDILATFGAFMAVLIAIEIFINITIYLRDDVIHVKIVMATALMAIARKVIILDFSLVSPEYMFATAALVFAMSIGYWLVVKNVETRTVSRKQVEKCFENPDECTVEDVHKNL